MGPKLLSKTLDMSLHGPDVPLQFVLIHHKAGVSRLHLEAPFQSIGSTLSFSFHLVLQPDAGPQSSVSFSRLYRKPDSERLLITAKASGAGHRRASTDYV